MEDKKNIIGYVRVSTDGQTTLRQKDLILEWVKAKGYLLNRIIEDKAISGASLNRNGLNEVLVTKNNEANIIVVTEISRLSRSENYVGAIDVINTIVNTNGIDIYVIDDDTYITKDTLKDITKFIYLLLQLDGAAKERKKISIRMATGRWDKLKVNHYAYLGGNIPFGFTLANNPKYNKNSSHNIEPTTIIIPVEEQIKQLNDMYDKIIDGYTLKRLALYVLDKGINIRKLYTKKTSKNEDNIITVLGGIIKNPIYKGERRYKGEVYDIEPLVSPIKWEKAINCLKDNKRFISYKGTFNPLKGLIKCECGRTMHLVVCKEYQYYRCYKKVNIKNEVLCTNFGLGKDIALKAIWKVSTLILKKGDYIEANNEVTSNIEDDIEEVKRTLKNKKDHLKELASNRSNVENNIASVTNIDLIKVLQSKWEAINEEANKLNAEMKKQEDKLKTLLKKQSEVKDNITLNILDSYNEETKSKLLHKVIDKVVWYSKKMRTGVLCIYYKNGYKKEVVIKNSQKHYSIIQLPNGMKYNVDKGTIDVTTMGKGIKYLENKKYDFTHILDSEIKSYSIEEWLNNFDISEYIIYNEVTHKFGSGN